jgi:hypothetical protein
MTPQMSTIQALLVAASSPIDAMMGMAGFVMEAQLRQIAPDGKRIA